MGSRNPSCLFFIMGSRNPSCFFFILGSSEPSYLLYILSVFFFFTLLSRDTSCLFLMQLPDTLGDIYTVSYTHLRAHETPEHLVCRLLLEKKKIKIKEITYG